MDSLRDNDCLLRNATKALTWGQFSQMTGKNVYILDTGDAPDEGNWFLVAEKEDSGVWCIGPGDYVKFEKEDYGNDYLAYRFQPFEFCDKNHCGLWDEQKQRCSIVTD